MGGGAAAASAVKAAAEPLAVPLPSPSTSSRSVSVVARRSVARQRRIATEAVSDRALLERSESSSQYMAERGVGHRQQCEDVQVDASTGLLGRT